MPFASTSNARLFYRWDGPDSAPVLLLSNSLGTSLEMWEPQIAALSRQFRVLRYDTRGHGCSDVTEGPYDLPMLGSDVLALLDALELDAVSFCGLSLGGMVGMWLGANAGQRIEKLILCNTSAYMGGAEQWNARIEVVRRAGMAALADGILERWFTPPFRHTHPESVGWIREMLLASPPEGYAACCAAVRDMDLRAALDRINAPTLVICGSQDPAAPPDHARLIAEQVPGARLVELDTAHLSNVEAPAAFTTAALSLLASLARG